MKRIFYVMALGIYLVSLNAQGQLTNGIEEYYKFDESAGSTQAIDAVGNNSSTSLSATVGSTTSKLGLSYSFNGSSNNVTLNPSLSYLTFGSGDFSVSAWVYPTSFSDNWKGILGGENGCFVLGAFGATGTVYVANNNFQGGPSSELNLNLNAWNHIVVTFNSTATSNNLTYYVNGTPKTASFITVFAAGATSNIIGGVTANTNPFSGNIDELGVWKRVLTSGEASQLYNAGAGVAYPFATNVAVTGVTLSTTSASIAVAGTQQLSPTVSPTNANNKNVNYLSSNTAIATVNASGLVTGVAAGTATITVTTTDQAKTATCAITVTTVAVTGVTVSTSTAALTVGGSQQLSATIAPANANQSVIWTTSNSAIATVSASGVVTAVVIGTATITATSVSNVTKKATCTVTVTAAIAQWQMGTGGAVYYNGGNIGIGITKPETKLHINSTTANAELPMRLSAFEVIGAPFWRVADLVVIPKSSTIPESFEIRQGTLSNESAAVLTLQTNFRLRSGNMYARKLIDLDNVSEGYYLDPSNTTTSLRVAGGIVAKRIDIMDPVPQSDFVFDKSYDLKKLEEVEAFIMQHKHLPEVPSAEEFKANGYSVGEMDDILLRKVEELTLYMIQQEKQIKEQNSRIIELEKELLTNKSSR